MAPYISLLQVMRKTMPRFKTTWALPGQALQTIDPYSFGPLLRSLHNLSVNFTVGDSL